MHLHIDGSNTMLIIQFTAEETIDPRDYGYWNIRNECYELSDWRLDYAMAYSRVLENPVAALFVLLLLGKYRKHTI